VFLAFFQLHVSYGLGMLWGFVTAPLKFGLPCRRGPAVFGPTEPGKG
jgi:hypothetical protein